MTLQQAACPSSEKFIEALEYATRLHSGQTKKGTNVPYVSHLLGVAALVLEDGGDEDEAVAALLHDAVEDQGGTKTLEDIRRKFGERVAGIVDGCTDAYSIPKPEWRPRKEKHIELLRHAPAEVIRVSLADKLHNASVILRDFSVHGDALWARFTVGKDDQLWYYRTLVTVFREHFRERRTSPLVDDLERVVSEIERLAAA